MKQCTKEDERQLTNRKDLLLPKGRWEEGKCQVKVSGKGLAQRSSHVPILPRASFVRLKVEMPLQPLLDL